MDAERADHLDLTSRVLQHTLAEVSHGTPGAGAGAAAAGHDAAAHERCCVICLEAVSEACEARPCRHADFDYLCLLSWLEQQARCPLCKAEVAEVRHGWDGAAWRQTYAVPPPPAPPKRAVPPPPPRRPRPPVRNGTSYAAPPPPPRPRPHQQQQQLPWGRPEAESEADARRRDERAVRVRRDVYRQQLYSLHMGSNRYSQYRDLTPALFERDAALVSRARTWLRRELRVFEFLHPAPPPPPPPETPPAAAGGHDVTTRRRANNAEFLLEYIVAILKTVDIQGSKGQAEDMLQEFLGRENARLLLHELRSFLRSPHSIEAWDRHVQYPSARKRRRSELGHDDDDGDDDATAEQSYAGGSEQAPRARGDFYRPSY